MTITSISFLGQSQSQISRLKTLNLSMYDLQRQLTTQKKTDSFAGLGTDSISVQRFRMEIGRVDSYMTNIQTVTTRLEMMNTGLSRASDASRDAISSLISQMRSSDVDMETVRLLADSALQIVRDVSNLDVDGRYLFAGSNSQDTPIASTDNARALMANEVTNWLAGLQTTTQTINNSEAFTNNDLGFNPAQTTAGKVTAMIDSSISIDYTSMATQNGLSRAIYALSFAAEMKLPDPAVDAATREDFDAVMDHILTALQDAVAQMDQEVTQIGSKYNLLNTIEENHVQEKSLFQTLVDERENVDITEVSAKINALQTQLTASYQVTSLVSQLSLVNFL